MIITKTKQWLDLLASIAVVVGLLLVAYEIQQANHLAAAQTENSIYEGWEALSMAEIETGINALNVRSLEDPTSLSEAEIADIGSWLVAVISLYQRNGRLFHEYGLTTDPFYETVGPDYFGGQIERSWFEENELWIRPATPQLADAIRHYIESTPLNSQR
jgi:hypothetical protein